MILIYLAGKGISLEVNIFASKNDPQMVYVSRKEHFNAAHKLYNNKWSQERNEEVFGACANENWHGHNFDLTVTVAGTPDPDTGFVVDLKKHGVLIRQDIVAKVDHKNLNVDVDFMQGKMPTIEVFITEIWKILAPAIKKMAASGKLHKLKLTETNKQFAEYFGEE
jgi:6-pyruvoyltetrahydropterin/6-carboxytetrahydropterin synthase